jgi:hypothetical protein
MVIAVLALTVHLYQRLLTMTCRIVMAVLVPAIHVLLRKERRGCPAQVRA